MNGFIQQAYFFPWIGYFKKVEESDIFIIQDDVQFRQKYISYAYIQNNGIILKLNLNIGKSISKKCNEIEFEFSRQRFEYLIFSIQRAYSKTSYFDVIFPKIFKILSRYQNKKVNLVQLNYQIFLEIRKLLDLNEKDIIFSSSLNSDNNKDLNHIKKIRQMNISNLIVGSLNTFEKLYDRKIFEDNNIEITELPYHLYQIQYSQRNCENFIEGLSILDVLFNVGIEKTKEIIQS